MRGLTTSFDVSAPPSMIMHHKDSYQPTMQSNDEVSISKHRRLSFKNRSLVVDSDGTSPVHLNDSQMIKHTPETQRVQTVHIESQDHVDHLNSPDLVSRLR